MTLPIELPEDLTEEQRDLLLEIEAIGRKYSEDQERDEHGRWTSGGGGSEFPALTPAGPAANTARDLIDQKMKDIFYFDGQFREQLQDYMSRTGLPEADVVAIFAKNDNVQEIGDTIIEQAKTDPELQTWLADPANAPYRDAQWVMGVTVADPNERSVERTWAMAVNGDFWGDDPAAEEFGIKMPSDPAEANAFYWAATLQDTWAGSSSDENVNSLALQSRANEIFGLGLDTTSLLGENVTDNPLSTGVEIARHEYFDSHASIMDAYLHAEYDRTQAMFKEAGITEMTLFRGMRWDATTGPAPEWAQQVGTTEATTNPLSSWSGDRDTARSFGGSGSYAAPYDRRPFGGIMLSAAVPVERIISTPFTGQGCLNEYEFVVLGGTDEVTIFEP